MSYFSQSKGERDTKGPVAAAVEPKPDLAARKPAQEIVSTLGPGLLVTGNIVATGAVQIFGRVFGDIRAARLLICKGAHVEGKIIAQEAVIDGTFKGTIQSNNVKLQATAVVEGEIFKQSLVIEQNAQFEGTSRRLETPVEAPTSDQINSPSPVVALVPEQIASPAYTDNAPAVSQGYGINGSAPATQTHPANGNAPSGAPY